MGAYNIVSPGAMQAGQPEDISVVLANFQALATLLNGGLDNTNIAVAAAIAASKLAGYPADGTKALLGDGTWGGVGDATPVTAFPGSPTDKQIIIFTDSTTVPTFHWRMMWLAAISKWIFLGGDPMTAVGATLTGYPVNATFGATTGAPSITVPRAGVYNVEVGADMQLFRAGDAVYLSMSGAGITASIANALISTTLSGSDNSSSSVVFATNLSLRKFFRQVTLTAAAFTLQGRFDQNGGGNGGSAITNGELSITPVLL